MSPREFCLPGLQIGRRVLHYDEIDSTSNACAALARDTSNHGLAVLAGTQTSGRGQHGRSWLCRPDAGVLLSVLLFPPAELRRPAILTAWAAVAVCDLIEELTGLKSAIKWPNDVLVAGKKICGILIEQSHGVVTGIGLNVQQTQAEFTAAELPLACSLHSVTGTSLDTAEVAKRLLHHLDRHYRQLELGDLAELERSWSARLGLAGREVLVETHTGLLQGYLRGLSFAGLLLEGAELQLLQPESVRHVHLAEG